MLLTDSTRAAASVAVVVMLMSAAPAAVAQDAAPPIPSEHSLDTGQVDVAAISLTGAAMELAAHDSSGQPRDPASLLYTTDLRPDGVEVGWDTSGIDAGAVFGDTVTLRLRGVAGPGEFRAEPLRLPVGEQGAATWTFPVPGRYVLTFAVEAHLLTGEPVTTEESYAVVVRGEPADAPLPDSAPESTPAAVPEPVQESAQFLPAARGLSAPAPAAQPAPTTPGSVVLSEGHVDAVAPRVLDGKLQIQVKDGTTVGQSGGQVRWREPANVVFQAKPASKATLPDDPALAFLGKKGDEVYLLPQQQQAGIIWTGWSTEELRADQISGPVTWRLTKVDGPGAFGIFTTGSFGDSAVIFNSTDGLPDSHSVPLGTHAHANWGFAKQGVYRLTFDVSATLADGRTVSDTEVYTFAVGNADPNSVLPGGSGPGGDTGGGGAGGGSDGPRLASTGVSGVLPLAAGGVMLLGLGGVVLLTGRRRQKTEER